MATIGPNWIMIGWEVIWPWFHKTQSFLQILSGKKWVISRLGHKSGRYYSTEWPRPEDKGHLEWPVILWHETGHFVTQIRPYPIPLGSRRWNWKFRKNFFKIRIPNFCYIQVIVFDLGYLSVEAVATKEVRYHEKNVKNFFYIFHILFMVAYFLSPNRCHW